MPPGGRGSRQESSPSACRRRTPAGWRRRSAAGASPSGLHCAPLAHATGGTEQTGTVRVSVSAFNTSREITAFLAAMQALV